jgi:hypothetical protein
MSRLKHLKAELAAIDHLNWFYWQTEDPNRYEKLGYLVRRDRRRELITEMLELIQRKQRSRLNILQRGCVRLE